MKLSLAVVIFLSLSYNAEAKDQDCKQIADQAYNSMMNYQLTGKTEIKEIANTKQVINMFDKKYEAMQYAYTIFDKCDK